MKTILKYLYIGIASIFTILVITSLIYVILPVKGPYINFVLDFLLAATSLLALGGMVSLMGISMYWLCLQGYKKLFGDKNEL